MDVGPIKAQFIFTWINSINSIIFGIIKLIYALKIEKIKKNYIKKKLWNVLAGGNMTAMFIKIGILVPKIV